MTENKTIDQYKTIVKLANKVYSQLRWGFKEEVYQDALEQEFICNGIPYVREKHLSVYYQVDGKDPVELQHTFRADFFCYDSIIVELKTVYLDDKMKEGAKSQVRNYMAATGKKNALLLNFYGNKDYVYFITQPSYIFKEVKQALNIEDNNSDTEIKGILNIE
ncbi:MAG: GxxExxY protein [Prevotella sp.]|nr:GxxExxY protein [Prevotella sp.]